MARQGQRRRIARGIYEDKTGRAGIYRDAAGKPREVRYPADATIREIRDDLDARQQKQRGSGKLSAERGTLDAAIDRWAKLEQHLASWKERRAELRAWSARLGPRRLSAIHKQDVQLAISAWGKAGVAPKTVRNRIWTLRHLYHVLYGPEAPTPADHVSRPKKTRTVAYWASPELILTVYQNLIAREQAGILRDAKTRARFMVRAATGRRPVEIMNAQPTDVDLEHRTWRVRDAKGGWSEGLYLNDDMLMAWQTFAEAKAWGKFNTGSQARALRAAGWPEGIRPYTLRHTAGIELSERGVDLQDVGGWLGHTSVQTTRSIYVGLLNSRMQRASKAMEGRLKGWKK